MPDSYNKLLELKDSKANNSVEEIIRYLSKYTPEIIVDKIIVANLRGKLADIWFDGFEAGKEDSHPAEPDPEERHGTMF